MVCLGFFNARKRQSLFSFSIALMETKSSTVVRSDAFSIKTLQPFVTRKNTGKIFTF